MRKSDGNKPGCRMTRMVARAEMKAKVGNRNRTSYDKRLFIRSAQGVPVCPFPFRMRTDSRDADKLQMHKGMDISFGAMRCWLPGITAKWWQWELKMPKPPKSRQPGTRRRADRKQDTERPYAPVLLLMSRWVI